MEVLEGEFAMALVMLWVLLMAGQMLLVLLLLMVVVVEMVCWGPQRRLGLTAVKNLAS
jgi:hypothetical protein